VRLLNVYVPNGIPWERANPVVYADPLNPWAPGTIDLANGDAIAEKVLQPFAPWQDYFNCVRGLQIEGLTNHDACNGVLTGGSGGGDSFDYQIAQDLGVPAYVLGLSYKKAQGFGPFSHLAKHGGTWVRARSNPLSAADDIFSGLGTADDDGSAGNDAAFRSELMTLTTDQIGRMREQVRGLTRAENKLAIHLEALAAIRDVSVSGALSCDVRPTMSRVAAADGLDHLDLANWAKTLDAHLELAGFAMLCGAAPVLTLHGLPPSTDFIMNFEGGPGVNGGYHLRSHGDRSGLAKCQRWMMDRIAAVLMPILDQDDPTTAGSKVIDNSIIYITSEITDGDSHQSNSGIHYGTSSAGAPNYNFNGKPAYNGGSLYSAHPNFLIGGGGGYFKRGGNDIVHQHSEITGGRPHGDLLATIADAMGSSVRNIGGERRVIEGLKA
jgi:hypothetical protein